MHNLKEKLYNIDEEIKNLNKARLDCLKEIEKKFNEKADEYLKNGHKIIKRKYNENDVAYGILEKIENQVWSDGNSCRLNTIKAYGLFIFTRKGFKNVSDMMVIRPENTFTCFNDLEEISLNEFNDVVSKWIEETEREYYLESTDGDEDDSWNWEEWFYDDGYYRYFDKNNYRALLNNEDLNNLYKRIK